MRALRRLLMIALPALAACNSIVGFDAFQKVSAIDEGDDDDSGEGSDGTKTNPREGGTPVREGGPGKPSSCDPTMPFEAPAALTGTVNSAAFEVAPSLTNDELTMVFQRTVGAENGSVLMATRTSIDQPFGDPIELAALAQGLDGLQQPTMTKDGLLLFFVGIGGSDSNIFTASRAATNVAFGNRRAFVEVNSRASESFPGVTPDGAELWLSVQPDVGVPRHLFRSVRDNLGNYGPAAAVTELASSRSEAGVAFSADGLTIYFGSERDGGKGDSDIWTARRATMSSSFGAATPIAELNSANGDYPGWISPDNCRLYFGSDRLGNGDLFVATRKR
jgi:WD40-like Beta Propeller Repeat